jgi:drug/metabolite transporter (DMT)-like permease
MLAAVLWSTGGLMIKSTDWDPLAILVGRNIFSAAVLFLYLRRFPLRWTRWMIVAAIAHILTAFLFISSTKLTTAANAIFLQYTAPLYIIPLGYWLLHEKPTRTDWISMLIIFGGMGLFFADKLSLSGLHGNLLALLSGVTMALMTVALRAQKHGTPAESILIGQIFTVVVGFPLLLHESWTATNMLIIVYLGVFQIGVAFVLFTNAIKHIPAIEATLISTLEPILNPLWVLLFIGEKPGVFGLVGGLIVISGVAVNAVSSARAAPQPAAAD